MKYCDDCGTGMNGNRCPNCHEELEIMDQYYELDMKLPSEEFQQKANAQAEAIKKRERQKRMDKAWDSLGTTLREGEESGEGV